MKISVPHTVIVGPLAFDIFYTSHVPADDNRIAGCTDCHLKQISVNLYLHRTRDQVLATVFHEMLHAVLGTTGLTAILGNVDLEEAVVLCFESYLTPATNWKDPIWQDWSNETIANYDEPIDDTK